MNKPWLYLLIFNLSLSNALHAQHSTEEKLQTILRQNRIPAISLAYIEQDSIYTIALGKKNVDQESKIDENTIFGGASLGKPLFAYLVVRLVAEKIIDLDRPITEYFIYDALALDQNQKTVTPRMILTHMSGLPNWRKDSLVFKFKPKEQFNYSGEGFLWLQKAIEHKTQKEIGLLLNTYVFQPLNMNSTSLVWQDSFEQNYALPHNEYMSPQKTWKPEKPNAASSIQTTARDYAKFLQELLSPQHIPVSLRDEMFKIQVPLDEKISWGLGISLQKTDQGLQHWHWGNNGTFRSYFTLSLKEKKAIVYFSNSKNGLSQTQDIINLYLLGNQPGWDWTGFYTQGLWFKWKFSVLYIFLPLLLLCFILIIFRKRFFKTSK